MFDPMHNGHLDLIERSLRIFDELIVAVVANPCKQPLFEVKERLEMIDEATAGMGRMRITSFDGLRIDLAHREQAARIVRGIRAQGINVISFGAGEPDFDTPRHIKDAAIRALEAGQTKYTEVGGVPELRAAVCHKLKRDLGLEYGPDEVTVSCGAKHTLYNIVMALVNPGDEVLIPSPFWVSYPEQVQLLGGVPVPVETSESTGFDLDPAAVRRAVTPKTKLLVLNSPGN